MRTDPCTVVVTLTDDTEITLQCQQMPWTWRTFTVFDEGKGKGRFTYIPTERIDSFDVTPIDPVEHPPSRPTLARRPTLAFSE